MSTTLLDRLKMFQDAERLLVEEAPGVYIVHRINTGLLKPYVVGKALEPNEAGFNGIQWPGFNTLSTVTGTMYIHKSVADYKK
jgi:peptide/nickel transport system substrate-binding protein/oligopeptide transport system substrate-binding protein